MLFIKALAAPPTLLPYITFPLLSTTILNQALLSYKYIYNFLFFTSLHYLSTGTANLIHNNFIIIYKVRFNVTPIHSPCTYPFLSCLHIIFLTCSLFCIFFLINVWPWWGVQSMIVVNIISSSFSNSVHKWVSSSTSNYDSH